MISSRISQSASRNRSGAALVITLAFVVILTGLIVAFFSRSTISRQASNANANQTKADLFAQGAAETIIGDLRQEIVDGSESPAAGITLYFPKKPENAVPKRTAGLAGVAGLENLVRRSVSGDGRASNVSTLTASQNGRIMTPSRWNEPLLLPFDTGATPPNYAPKLPSGTFTAPDWILVTREGKNPTSLSGGTASPTNTSMIIGRYAYQIYDQGGLLDVNVAGYPNPNESPAVTGSLANVPTYKSALAFADLTTLGLTQNQVDQLTGWRNFASASGLTGSLPGLSWTAITKTNYYSYVLSNTTGFLTPANASLSNPGNMSDRLFTSRQSMLRFFMRTLSGSSTVSIQKALPYLTHFSRGLNQPSLAPDFSGNKDSYRTRPKVAAADKGGYNLPMGKTEDDLNPSFLAIRVPGNDPTQKAFDRNKGAPNIGALVPAYETDPLVGTRFPLSRLVWLTYKGPSQGKTGVDINDLKNNLGVTQAMLDLGTLANVETYFGLTWKNQGFWEYSKYATSGGAIKTLAEVAAENPKREANFIELLKAAIMVGSIGKGGATSTSTGMTVGSDHPISVQHSRDTIPDNQIIQIAANIIDQADVDGYPTRIQYFDREFRGVENVPYLYRVRNAAIKIEDPALPPGQKVTGQGSQQQAKFAHATDGKFVFMQQPEVWNPHSYDSANSDRMLGKPRPQSFELVAYSNALPALPPDNPNSGGFEVYSAAELNYRFSPTGQPTAALKEANTKMTFKDNTGALFREPTLLVKLGKPANSDLRAPGLQAALGAAGLPGGENLLSIGKSSAYPASVSDDGRYTGVYLGWNVAVWDDSTISGTPTLLATHLVAANSAPPSPPSPTMLYQIRCDDPNVSGKFYAFDEKLFDMRAGVQTGDNRMAASTTWAGAYRLKDAQYESTLLNPPDYQAQIIGWGRIATCFDPRTSRFGFFTGRSDTIGKNDADNIIQLRSFPPGAPNVTGAMTGLRWVDPQNNVLESNRPDENAGYGGYRPFGAPPGNSLAWEVADTPRYGLYTQNSRNVKDNLKRFSGDGSLPAGSGLKSRWFGDSDWIIRRAMAAHVEGGAGDVPAKTLTGLPMATAFYNASSARQKESRPIILNRPFRSVAELGYVYSDIPWRNLDFSTPESGFAPLLDVFCINENTNSGSLIAGKVNLNTRQAPVLQAILAGAYRDEYAGGAAPKPFTVTEAKTIADALVARTSDLATAGKGHMVNIADLVGRWKVGTALPAGADSGNKFFDGFSADLSGTNDYTNNIARYREAAMRALTAAGQTRVWNLLIDVVAQTGRYPQSATNAEKFVVEGEQRLWVHVALDRLTGQVIDQNVEVVTE